MEKKLYQQSSLFVCLGVVGEVYDGCLHQSKDSRNELKSAKKD